MEKYIKVNAKVAKFLHLDTIRNAVKDGNYLLWMMDVQEFGSPADIPQILTQIGGILLTGAEAREEQDGVANRNLPVPTDKRFLIDSEDNEPDDSPGAEVDSPEDENSGNGADSPEGETDLKQEGGNDE